MGARGLIVRFVPSNINLPFQTIGLELGARGLIVRFVHNNINLPFQTIGLELGAKGLMVRFVPVEKRTCWESGDQLTQ